MTIQRTLNQRSQTGNALMWHMKETLKAAGWTVPRSGSGNGGLFATSDVFGSFAEGGITAVGVGIGSEELGNNGCWFVVQDPAGNRELLFDRPPQNSSSYDGYYNVSYSRAAGFTGGSATVLPTATDQENIFGVPGSNGTQWAPLGGSPCMIHVAADDQASPAGEYGFVAAAFISINQTDGVVFLDDLRNQAVGDPHALAVGVLKPGPEATEMITEATSTIWCWVDVGGPGEAWERIAYAWPTTLANRWEDLPAGASRYDGKERPLPIFAVDSNIGGYLGSSRWFRASPLGPTRHYNTQEGRTVITFDDTVLVDFWDGASDPETI